MTSLTKARIIVRILNVHMGPLKTFNREIHNLRTLSHSFYGATNAEPYSSTSVKRFQDIPGPRGIYSIPIVGSAVLLSKYGFPKAYLVFRELHKKYGRIVRVKMGFQWHVILFDPEFIYTTISHEGKYPVRIVPPIMTAYAKRHGFGKSFSSAQGKDWSNLRGIIQHKLKPTEISKYIPIQSACTDDLVHWLSMNNDEKQDVEDTIRRFVSDATAAVGFNAKMGFLKDKGKNEENEIFLKSTRQMMHMIGESFYKFPFYLFFKTNFYNRYEEAANYVYRYGFKRIKESTTGSSENKQELNILNSLLTDKSMPVDIIPYAITGMVFSGLETTTRPILWTLWLLGSHKEKQQKIYEEITTNVPDGELTFDRLRHLPYLKACIKESFRLIFPSLNGTVRVIPDDMTLDNYHIPKGTPVHFGLNSLCNSEEYFVSPEQFIPERWLPEEKDRNKIRLMAMCVQPFGFGKRNCPGRRIAEQLIHITLIKILQNFELSVPDEARDVGLYYHTLAFPEKPIKINFTKRKRDVP